MCAAGSDLAVAWVSFRDGHDTLQLARVGTSGEVRDQWRIDGGDDVYLLDPTLVATEDGAWLLYAAEKRRNWDIYACELRERGPTPPRRLTRSPAVDVRPAGTIHQGRLVVAWESNREGSRQVYSLTPGGSPTPVSSTGGSSYEPSLASHHGRLFAAWHSFHEGNYDIYLAEGPGGVWSAPRRLTEAPTVDRHVNLVPGAELWLLWENANSRGYHVGSTSARRTRIAALRGGELVQPVGVDAHPLARDAEAGVAVVDDAGRLLVSHLSARDRNSGWELYGECFTGAAWTAPSRLTAMKMMDRRPSLAVVGDSLFTVFQADHNPNSWPTPEDSLDAASDIYLVRTSLDSYPPATETRFEPFSEPGDPYEAAAIRLARGEDRPVRSIEYEGETLYLYYGDLHEHSDLSVCNRVGDQSLQESYNSMRDICRYDFGAVTDHGYNLSPPVWSYKAKLARINHDPGRFLTFLAEEWTSTFEEYSHEHPHGFYGHRNLILGDPYFPTYYSARDRMTPDDLWAELRARDADFVHIPHQLADVGNVPMDYSFHDERAQPVAEIFQTRGSYEYDGCPRQAVNSEAEGHFMHDIWAAGLVIGVIAAPDHGGGMGKAAVFAPELTREAILEALRQRRCYGTTAAKIFLDVRVDGHLMGEKLQEDPGDSVRIDIVVDCPQPIKELAICRSNEFIHTVTDLPARTELTFVDEAPLHGSSYYYVRVIQEDDEIAWTSPVWFGLGHGHEH
jgi:hypothetical protein